MVRWHVALFVAAVGVAGCDRPDVTPTSATETPPPSPFSGLSCAPPAGVRAHTVTLPGAPPLVVWVANVSPARGATVRPGEFYEIQSGSSGPAGFTNVIQTFVGDSPNATGGFVSANTGGCGRSVVGMAIPRSERTLYLYVRVWVRPGSVPLPGLGGVFGTAPDYEASEALDWTIAP